jgi:hypothetical protein
MVLMAESAAGAAILFFFIYAVSAVILGFICASVAGAKGLSTIGWFFAGLLFSFAGLIAVAGMPDLVSRKYLRRLAEALPPTEGNL